MIINNLKIEAQTIVNNNINLVLSRILDKEYLELLELKNMCKHEFTQYFFHEHFLKFSNYDTPEHYFSNENEYSSINDYLITNIQYIDCIVEYFSYSEKKKNLIINKLKEVVR